MALFDKPLPRKLLLLVSLFSLTVCLILMGSHLQTQLDWPASMISQMDVVESSGVHELSDVSAFHRFWLERAARKLKALEPFLATIGPLKHPLALQIDTVDSLRYDVSGDKIAIGLEVLKASGQLERSVLKTWILQKTRNHVLTSTLRQEVTADLLYAFFKGSLNLEDPVLHKSVDFPKVNSEWTDLLLPLDRFCKTAWRPLELLTICQTLRDSNSFISTPMMARPLIGSLVWAKYNELKWSQREEFLRAFVETIEASPGQRVLPIANDPLLPRIPSEWRLFIEHEARSLAPPSENRVPQLPENEALLLRKSSHGWQIEPGGLAMAAGDVSNLKTSRLIWESCEQPKISELLAISSSAQRILFVQNCNDAKVDYFGYRHGRLPKDQIENFAVANPKIKFVAFHRDSLLLAQKKGLTDQIDLISWVLETPRVDLQIADAYFGVSQARWHKDINAFRTAGHLEAIEYFRQ